MGVSDLIETIVVTCLGLFVAFAGYKCFRASITFMGIFAGWELSNFLWDLFASDLGLAGNDNAWMITVGIFVVALGASAFAFYKKAIIYATMTAVAFWFYNGYVTTNPPDNEGAKIVIGFIGILIGIVAGLAVFKIQKWAIMLITSIIGGRLVAVALTPVLVQIDSVSDIAKQLIDKIFTGEGANMSDSIAIMGLLLLIIAVAGFVVQVVNKE